MIKTQLFSIKQFQGAFKLFNVVQRVLLSSVLLIFLGSCWERQDIDVTGPDMPRYTLYGVVGYAGESIHVAGLNIQITQIEVYQGDVLEPMVTSTDSTGAYSFPDLFRGRYRVRVFQQSLAIYEQDVGLINFADREYNITIPRAIQLLDQLIVFERGEEAQGLSVFDQSPLALTCQGDREILRKEASSIAITPVEQSHWQHSGLANMGNGKYASIRRQIDTTVVEGNTGISAPHYYLTSFDLPAETVTPTDQAVSGGQLTETFDQTGYWMLITNFMKQKLLYRTDLLGNTLQSVPLAAKLAGGFSFVQNDTAFWAVDTATASVWLGSMSDSLYAHLSYKVYDTADSLIRSENANPVKYIAPFGDTGLFIARETGVWSAEILGL